MNKLILEIFKKISLNMNMRILKENKKYYLQENEVKIKITKNIAYKLLEGKIWNMYMSLKVICKIV